MHVHFAVIICTRNRPFLLRNLLQSISESNVKPTQIVLVSSGVEIKEIVTPYSDVLNLKHIHTEKIGQSNQKVIGISSLEKEINWVFFLDDDLLLLPSSIHHAIEKIKEITDKNIGGIGTQIMPFKIPKNLNKKGKRNASTAKLGKILKSGRALPYQSKIETSTEWLNGASIWRREVLQQYRLPILNSTYAAYEDVIFSTDVNKSYDLIYDPKIVIQEQISHNKAQSNVSAFLYINLWTGYFVCTDSRTNITSFKVLTIIRLFKFSTQKIIFKHRGFKDITKALKCTYHLVVLPNHKTRSREIILSLIKQEISRQP